MHTRDRIPYLAMGCILLLAAVGSGCATTGSDGPVTIEVGSFFAPPEAESWLRNEIAAFDSSHPDIKVRIKDLRMPQRQRFQTHNDYFGENVESRLAANVVGIDSLTGYLVPYLVDRNELVAIDELDQPGDSFRFEDFYTNQFDSVRYQDKTWGVPWLAWDNVLVLDWELFEEAGFSNPPRTWDELVDAAAKLTRDTDGDGRIDQWGLRFKTNDDSVPYLILSMILQQGGTIMREGRFDVSDPAVERIFRFAHDLAFGWNIARRDSRSMGAVLRDPSLRYAMHLVTNHDVGAALDRTDLRLVPVPTFTGKPHSYAHSRRYFAVRNATRREEEASWEFVKWMTRADISLPPTLAGFPVRKDFTDRPDFQRLIADKIQNAELIFEVCANGEDSLEQVFDRASGLERYWQTVALAIEEIQAYDQYSARAVQRANGVIGERYPGD